MPCADRRMKKKDDRFAFFQPYHVRRSSAMAIVLMVWNKIKKMTRMATTILMASNLELAPVTVGPVGSVGNSSAYFGVSSSACIPDISSAYCEAKSSFAANVLLRVRS